MFELFLEQSLAFLPSDFAKFCTQNYKSHIKIPLLLSKEFLRIVASPLGFLYGGAINIKNKWI